MLRTLLFLLTAIAALGAEDPWAKVRELKSGSEIRIYKKDAKQPILAKMDEADDERLVVVVKNEQTAIPKDQIDRIDYRRARPGSRVTKESRTVTGSNAEVRPPGPRQGTPVPSSSTSSGVSIQSKPDFETIYRRTTPAPQK